MAVTLKDARGYLYTAILNHDNKLLKESIALTQRLGGDLNKCWTKPDDKCNNKKSPIVLSAYQHNYEAMRLLFNTGEIDLSLEDRRGTPLMISACRTGDENVVAEILRRRSGLVNVQSACKIHPLHAACFSSIRSTYSIIFDSDWGSPAVKQSLISWWKGGEFVPTTPLRARWPGAIPLVALLLKHGANPAIEESSGLSPLKAVQDLTCSIKDIEVFELPGFVKFTGNTGQILTFQISIRDRKTGGKELKVTVDVDFNMELPKDVALSAAASEAIAKAGKRTMRGLIEAYAPKNTSSHSDGDLRDIKREVERIKISTLQSATEVKVMKEGLTQLHDEHVVVYEEYRDRKVYQERLNAVKKDKGSPVYAFFHTVSQELDRLFFTYKLLMKDPKKFDKTEAASTVIEALAKFAPPPFDVPVKAVAFLVSAYGQYSLHQEQSRVRALLERNHGPMCDDLALRLSEHYGKQLAEMEPKQAEELALNAVGVIFALMCDSKKTINPLDSAQSIQDQLFEAVKTSDFFSGRLKKLLAPPTKSRFMLPSFGSKPTPPTAPRSASQPPGRRTDKQPEDPHSPKTSKSASILSAFTRSKSPKPQTVAPSVTSSTMCKPTAPSSVGKSTNVVQSVK